MLLKGSLIAAHSSSFLAYLNGTGEDGIVLIDRSALIHR
jgi:hypothetical protein